MKQWKISIWGLDNTHTLTQQVAITVVNLKKEDQNAIRYSMYTYTYRYIYIYGKDKSLHTNDGEAILSNNFWGVDFVASGWVMVSHTFTGM